MSHFPRVSSSLWLWVLLFILQAVSVENTDWCMNLSTIKSKPKCLLALRVINLLLTFFQCQKPVRNLRTQNHSVISFKWRKFRVKYGKRKKHTKIYFEVLLYIAKEFYRQRCHFITVPMRINAVEISANLVSVGLEMDQWILLVLKKKGWTAGRFPVPTAGPELSSVWQYFFVFLLSCWLPLLQCVLFLCSNW